MKRIMLFLICSLLFACSAPGSGPQETPEDKPDEPQVQTDVLPAVAADPMSWVALAPDGTWMEEYPAEHIAKTVGIFYFLWHGCHGYDKFENNNYVKYPGPNDIHSPYNNEEIYSANPANPQFGDFDVFHHWGEPYLGYYISDDDWVFRKHAQMLSDAGVDVIFIDATNGYDYFDNLKVLADAFLELRAKGCKTPQFAYLLNVGASEVFDRLYNLMYSKNLYKDLWFQWGGKPMILCYAPAIASPAIAQFTTRMSWFTYNLNYMDQWYDENGGEDKLPWGGWYPQKPGYHGGVIESASVMAATHPLDNMGRSFDPLTWTEPDVKVPEKGIHFKAQFAKAMEYNPKMMFFTGWNEWVAMRYRPSEDRNMIGIPSTEFGCFFVDHFNHEYSRDLEPLRGGFGDAYYYMLADFCRKFKGAKPPKKYSGTAEIVLDGKCDDWADVQASFGDDTGDATLHDHVGWGRLGHLVNNTARNDISLCKVATDGENLYFYVQTDGDLTSCLGKDWMKLYIGVRPKEQPAWEGFDFCVQRLHIDGDAVALEQCQGGYSWKYICDVPRKIGKRCLELSIPLEKLGLSSGGFTVDFKWIDNAASDGDIQTCLSDGDSAPDGRFRYRYVWKPS